VSLTIDDVRLRLCIETQVFEYRFTCPVCTTLNVSEISRPTFDLLEAAGVHCHEWHLPTELAMSPDGPRICLDDVDRFRQFIENHDEFHAALDSLVMNTPLPPTDS